MNSYEAENHTLKQDKESWFVTPRLQSDFLDGVITDNINRKLKKKHIKKEVSEEGEVDKIENEDNPETDRPVPMLGFSGRFF